MGALPRAGPPPGGALTASVPEGEPLARRWEQDLAPRSGENSQGRGVAETAGPGAPVPAGLSCTQRASEPER